MNYEDQDVTAKVGDKLLLNEYNIMYEQKSEVGELNKTDWKKIGKGALIALGGALGTYALTVLPTIDLATFGKYAPLAGAGISVLINLISKFLSKGK